MPEPSVLKLIDGLGGAEVPVLAVESDTYRTAATVAGVRGVLTAESDRKIAAALGVFSDHVDRQGLLSRLDVARSDRVTPMMFEHELIDRARADRRHIVLPEGTEERILRAAEQRAAPRRGRPDPARRPRRRRSRAADLGLELGRPPGGRPGRPPNGARTSPTTYYELRAHKGVARPVAYDVVADVTYFGTMMVHEGLADGMVSGAAHTTAATIRPAFEIIRPSPASRSSSSVFFMLLADRVLVYGDCAVNPTPTPRSWPTSPSPRRTPPPSSASSRGWPCCPTRPASRARAATSRRSRAGDRDGPRAPARPAGRGADPVRRGDRPRGRARPSCRTARSPAGRRCSSSPT